MNTQKQIEALETKLAEVSAELQRLKGQKAGQWAPMIGESYFIPDMEGVVGPTRQWDDLDCEKEWLARGRIFPDTLEGREAAEWFAFCEGFRERWKRSADVGPNGDGYYPAIDGNGRFCIWKMFGNAGLKKWLTPEACRAFVDSEGGPEKFKEILERGIL